MAFYAAVSEFDRNSSMETAKSKARCATLEIRVSSQAKAFSGPAEAHRDLHSPLFLISSLAAAAGEECR
jgi:hypothetical protein